jgi:hypothetical protein
MLKLYDFPKFYVYIRIFSRFQLDCGHNSLILLFVQICFELLIESTSERFFNSHTVECFKNLDYAESFNIIYLNYQNV